MTRVVRNAALFMVAGILVASAAVANVPDPAHSTLQSAYLELEGQSAGAPDNCSDGNCADYTLTVRDFANNPVAGANVIVDFSACSDIVLSCDQLTGTTGQTNIGGKMISATTNAVGAVTLRIQGAATGAPTTTVSTSAGTNAGVPCGQVYANGVNLGPVIVSAYDINALGTSTSTAVGSGDVSLIFAEAAKVGGGAQPRARDDFNHLGSSLNTINAADVSRLLAMALNQGAGTGSKITGPYCP